MDKLMLVFSAICFTNLKLMIQILLGNHVGFNPMNIIAPSTSVQAWGKSSKIRLGKMVQIRANSELRASGGELVIGDGVFINRNCVICTRERITIAQGVTIGPNSCIYDHDHSGDGGFVTASVCLEEGVWVGANASILKGVTVGKNAVVAAGAVVTHDVPPYSIYGGVPGRVLKMRFTEEQVLNHSQKLK